MRETIVDPVLAAGVDAEYILMENTRHEFNEAYYSQVRDWIDRKVLRGGLAKNLERFRESVDAEDWADALRAYDNVVLLTGTNQSERVEADKLLESVNAAGKTAWAGLRKGAPTAEAIIDFVKAWSPCEVANAAVAVGNPLGEAALRELLSRESENRWSELGTFTRKWKRFSVAAQARASLEKEGRKARKQAEALAGADERIKAWRDLTIRYPDTKVAAHADQQLDAALRSEGMKVFEITDKTAKVERLKELMELFSGTRQGNRMTKFYRWETEPQKEWRPWVLEREAKRAQKKKDAENKEGS